MNVVRQWHDLGRVQEPVTLAIGSFDGVHRGHQQILQKTLRAARENGGQAWAMTFDPHPAKVLRPNLAPALLTSTPHKLRLMEELGLDGCAVLPFTTELAALESEPFVDQLCFSVPSLAEMVVGVNWTFGRRASGNAVVLQEIAARKGFAVCVVEPVYWKGMPISSTRIRQEVTRGRLAVAAELLGRPFSILGTVKKGRGLGRQFGFPTANLDPHNEVRPPPGVYAVQATIQGHRYNGAAFRPGSRSAHAPEGDLIEVHFMDAQLDLYHQDIEVFFVSFLREDRRFDNVEQLRLQIAQDVEQIRGMLQS
jgi:riboflavin kinase / FMN adenylyltransferase